MRSEHQLRDDLGRRLSAPLNLGIANVEDRIILLTLTINLRNVASIAHDEVHSYPSLNRISKPNPSSLAIYFSFVPNLRYVAVVGH